ncbi:MAG: hypothetical protein ACLTBV_21220 [Enterocloster bolteae]
MTMPRMLHVHLVRSREVHAEILKIDYEKALTMPGLKRLLPVKMCRAKMGLASTIMISPFWQG